MLRVFASVVSVITIVLSVTHAGVVPKVVIAVRLEGRITLDGLLKEPQWLAAPAITDFTQSYPREGDKPTENTSLRILYDDHNLYVGVTCYDSDPRKIVEQLTRRDRVPESDRFTIEIDSYHDHQTGFLFSANVSGVQSDGALSQEGVVYDGSWDAVWRVKTRRIAEGWSAEFEIPYNALRFSERPNRIYEWAINFRRYISRKKETDEWVVIPRSERLLIPRWGHVQGIRNIKPPLHLDLLPYVSNTSDFKTASSSNPSSSENRFDGGLDLKYGLSRNFTLDAAINPDFGQVEIDRAVLNLTVFETLFLEKRPFFVEGASLFEFGTSIDNTPFPLFFSRRIGKRPSGSFSLVAPAGGTIENNPLVTTILGAAKVSGQLGSGFSLGFLTAVTDEEDARIKDSAGGTSTVNTEPRASYSVIRVKKTVARNSWIGAIATVTSKENTLPAETGGIDWNLRLGEGSYTFDGYFAAARSSSDFTERNGTAGRLLFSRISAKHWLYTASYDFFSRHFNSNDIGYFAQPHDHGGYLQLLYREYYGRGLFRLYGISLVPEFRWNWNSVRTKAQLTTEFGAEFTNFWKLTLRHVYQPPSYLDEEQGIIGTYRRPVDNEFLAQVGSDARDAVSGTLTTIYDSDYRRKNTLSAGLSLMVRPTSWADLSPSVSYQRTRGEQAWLFPDGNIFDPAVSPAAFSVFGDRDIDVLDLALRGTVTFTTTLSLQFYTQVFIARGRYGNFKRLAGSSDLPAYDYQAFPGYTNHDFNNTTFNANVLLRWEYLPGSTMYLVWTQERSGDNLNYPTNFGRRIEDAFALPHEDVLLLKVSYWFAL